MSLRIGRYRLLEPLGQGGMGEVYRANCDLGYGMKREVAVKRLHPRFSRKPAFSRTLLDEARALLSLHHQNVVQILDLLEHRHDIYLVMEYVDGVDLHRLLEQARQHGVLIPRNYLFAIALQLLQGLAATHAACNQKGESLRLIHRDLSPGNVLISWQGEVKLADFGIARGSHRDHPTTAASLKGKFAYMSPEQAAGLPLDQRSDLFSAGLLLFELFTGTSAIDASSDLEALQLIQKGTIDWSQATMIPSELVLMLKRALAKEPHERYRSAAELLLVVNAFVKSAGSAATTLELGRFLQKTILPHVPSKRRFSFTTRHLDKPQRTQQPRVIARALTLLSLVPLFFMMPHQRVSAPPFQENLSTFPRRSFSKPESLLQVQARPWGKVTIPGLVLEQETPFRMFLPAGTYEVSIVHPPTQKTLRHKVILKGKSPLHCAASFEGEGKITCR